MHCSFVHQKKFLSQDKIKLATTFDAFKFFHIDQMTSIDTVERTIPCRFFSPLAYRPYWCNKKSVVNPPKAYLPTTES
jgi:hypothetical protein